MKEEEKSMIIEPLLCLYACMSETQHKKATNRGDGDILNQSRKRGRVWEGGREGGKEKGGKEGRRLREGSVRI